MRSNLVDPRVNVNDFLVICFDWLVILSCMWHILTILIAMRWQVTDKRQSILNAAKQLFVELGVSGTTIAEIAKHAGIAKGSVYSHFKSKQDIVIALMNDSIERSQSMLQQLIEQQSDSADGIMEQYIAQELSLMSEERALNQAIAMDDSLMMNDDMMQVIQNYRSEYYQNQLVLLNKAYGEQSQPWHMDILTLLNGAFHEYGLYMTLDDANFDLDSCAKVIAFSLSASLQALTNSDLTPAISIDALQSIEQQTQQSTTEKAKLLVQNMSNSAQHFEDKMKLEAEETCQLLLAQLELETPSNVMLRALIANLSPYGELNRDRVKLAELLDIALI